jgi:septum site-determining protein MinC
MGETVQTSIQIKGIRDGLLITLGEGDWQDQRLACLAGIDEKPAFFQGARVALDVGRFELRVAELSSLRDELSERGISLWAVLSESDLTQRTAQNLGLATRLAKPKLPEFLAPPESEPVGEDVARWVKGPLRSGVRIEYPGSVIVLGDVNPGAEISAGKNVVVWGRLRGVVHAGAAGDEAAVVCALELAPTQLRIAGTIATSPPDEERSQPEVASLVDGQIVARPWQTV